MSVHAGVSLQCVYVTAGTEAKGDADVLAVSRLFAGWPCLQCSATAHRVSRIWHKDCKLQASCFSPDYASAFKIRAVFLCFHGS